VNPRRINAVLSASGVPLEGNRLVRVTYIDESGSSQREPILVEAGIIVNGDEQVVPVEEHLESLVEKHIPPEHWDGFFFHATDMYGGGKKDCIFHDKNSWPEEKRFAILDDLVAIPAMFGLPICVGIVEKSLFPPPTETQHTPQEIAVAAHAMAIIQCEIGVELWLRANTEKEITHIIAENNDEVRLAAKQAHTMLRNKDAIKKEGYAADHPCFPFKRIRDGLQFTTKAESRLLQVADVCAWAIRRAGNNAPHAFRFYGPLKPQIVSPNVWQEASLRAQSS
jgi:Protein of unknown function (DUF3800)